MELRYDILVENIKKLPLPEKEELKNLIEKSLLKKSEKKFMKII